MHRGSGRSRTARSSPQLGARCGAPPQERYNLFNQHAASYVWKRLGKPLDMKQTLSENGVEDDSAQLRAVGIDPDDHVRAKLRGRGGWSTSWGAGGGFGALYSVSVFVVWCS